ncbi:unnamed protein product [Parnassius apollo]|uniref:(apollo) hypothetical protein n=1 Tax=Parnassius apollo TaxID=110799 RepID=A0A8S3W1I0_PARAO|nr:unnamed protein product [Parnassius apollo]
MCRSTVEKEEVFLSQNAAGGNNDATLKEIGGHVERLSIVTYIVLAIIGLVAVYVGLRMYRSCHRTWIQQEIGMSTMQRIRSSIRGRTEVEIRNYLVKKGQTRYKGNVISTKLDQAKSAYENCCKIYLLIEKSKDINLKSTIDLYQKIKQKYEEIEKLCTFPVTVDLGKMDFDIKVACSLIPVMDGVEATTKRLIDSVEMYADMLDNSGKVLLIIFVLKSRLNENAKLRIASSYKTIQELIDDMRKYLLPKKSFMAIQTKLQNIQQGSRSIEDYGTEVEKLFTELTITQADGKEEVFSILKPINESFAIKRFSDGLRSAKMSTIISARGFSSLKDAIQAAKDEECTSFQPPGNILYASKNGRHSAHNIRRSQGQRGIYRSQYGNNYHRGHKFNNHYNQGQGSSGKTRANYRPSYNNQRGNRGSRYVRNRGRGQNSFPVEKVADTHQCDKDDNADGEEKQSIEAICAKYSDIFHLEGDKLTTTNIYEQSIVLKQNSTPVYVKPYRLP